MILCIRAHKQVLRRDIRALRCVVSIYALLFDRLDRRVAR